MKRSIALLAALALMLSMAACAPKDPAPSSSGGSTPSGNSSQADPSGGASAYEVTEPVKIEFWHNNALEEKVKMINDCVNAFNASQELVEVEAVYIGDYDAIDEQLIAAQAAGSGVPALVAINFPRVITYATNGIVEPLDPYFEAFDFDVSEFVEGFISPLTVDGSIYALPWGVSSSVMYYNMDLLNQLDISIPENWEDLKAMCKTIYEETGNCGFSVSGNINYFNVPLINTGADPFGDGTASNMDDPKIVNWIKEFQEMCDLGYMEFVNGADADSQVRASFTGGLCASIMETSSVAMQFAANSPFEVKCLMPWGMERNNATAAGSSIIIPMSNSQQVKNAAWQFLSFLTNEEWALEAAIYLGTYPIRDSITEDPAKVQRILDTYPIYDELYTQLDRVVSKNKTPYYTSGMKLISSYIGQIIIDGADFDSTYQAMNDELNNLMSGN